MDPAWGGLYNLASGLQSGLNFGLNLKESKDKEDYNKRMAEIQARFAGTREFEALSKAGVGGTTVSEAITGRNPAFNERMAQQNALEKQSAEAQNYAQMMGANTGAYRAMGEFGLQKSPTDVLTPPSGLSSLVPKTDPSAAKSFATTARANNRVGSGIEERQYEAKFEVWNQLRKAESDLTKQLTTLTTSGFGTKNPQIDAQMGLIKRDLAKAQSQRRLLGNELGLPDAIQTEEPVSEARKMLDMLK